MVLKITNLHILRYLPTYWLYLLERYTIEVDGTDAVQEQLMKDVIAPILFSGEWRDERVNALSGDEKIRAYSLSLKIYQSTGDIEISAEEALMIKEAALILNPGGYAQIVKLIDG
mgnify:CR=1 FL=1